MPRLALPTRFNQQPQQALELAPHWQRNAVVVAPLRDLSGRNVADLGNPIINSATLPDIVNRSDGRLLSFSNVSQILSTTNNVNPNTPFTLFVRVKPAALNTGYTRILETDYASSFYLGANTGSQYAFIVNNSPLEGCIGGQQVVGQTDFLVGTFDGTSQITLYVNGIPTGSTTTTAPTSLWQMAIGRYPFSAAANWVGDLDLVGFYNRAFSAQEIYALAQNPWQLFKTPPRRIYTVASTGTSGTLAVTTGDDTASGQGTTTVTGTVAVTTGSDTLSAQGSPEVTGSVAVTTGDDTVVASGSVGSAVSGTLAVTTADDTANAQGTTTVTGSLAVTTGNDTVSAQGSPIVSGTISVTTADDTVAASGSVGSAVSGTLDVTTGDDTSAAQGTTTVTGTISVTTGDDTLAASGDVSLSPIDGTLDVTTGSDTLAAQGVVPAVGTLDQTEGHDTLVATGVVAGGVIVEVLSPTSTTSSAKIKKPGIPTGTPDWLKTTMEILMGRRGNRITIPAQPTLTFSATPTQAECEALYAYTNDVRNALEQIITRMDS